MASTTLAQTFRFTQDNRHLAEQLEIRDAECAALRAELAAVKAATYCPHCQLARPEASALICTACRLQLGPALRIAR